MLDSNIVISINTTADSNTIYTLEWKWYNLMKKSHKISIKKMEMDYIL